MWSDIMPNKTLPTYMRVSRTWPPWSLLKSKNGGKAQGPATILWHARTLSILTHPKDLILMIAAPLDFGLNFLSPTYDGLPHLDIEILSFPRWWFMDTNMDFWIIIIAIKIFLILMNIIMRISFNVSLIYSLFGLWITRHFSFSSSST